MVSMVGVLLLVVAIGGAFIQMFNAEVATGIGIMAFLTMGLGMVVGTNDEGERLDDEEPSIVGHGH